MDGIEEKKRAFEKWKESLQNPSQWYVACEQCNTRILLNGEDEPEDADEANEFYRKHHTHEGYTGHVHETEFENATLEQAFNSGWDACMDTEQ